MIFLIWLQPQFIHLLCLKKINPALTGLPQGPKAPKHRPCKNKPSLSFLLPPLQFGGKGLRKKKETNFSQREEKNDPQELLHPQLLLTPPPLAGSSSCCASVGTIHTSKSLRAGIQGSQQGTYSISVTQHSRGCSCLTVPKPNQ